MAKTPELFDRGLAVRKEVLGAPYVEAALQGAGPFGEDFQTFVTETAWGSVWSRPGLDRKTRSMLTMRARASWSPMVITVLKSEVVPSAMGGISVSSPLGRDALAGGRLGE